MHLLAAMAAAAPGAQPATSCSALTAVPFDAAELLSSVAVDAHDGLPAHCRVRGVEVPAINFELRLPSLEDWNGKFYMAGCSGFCGRLDYTGLVATHFAWVVQANRREDGSTGENGVGAVVATGATRDAESAVGGVCLQNDEIAVLEKWYGGARDSQGRALYAGGVPPGSEPYWPLWLSGAPGTRNPPLVTLFARDFLRYMAFAHDPGEGYDTPDYDFDRDPARLAHMAARYDAEQTDTIAAQRRDAAGAIQWSRPVCAYPRVAVLKAGGNPHRADDFECRMPES